METTWRLQLKSDVATFVVIFEKIPEGYRYNAGVLGDKAHLISVQMTEEQAMLKWNALVDKGYKQVS